MSKFYRYLHKRALQPWYAIEIESQPEASSKIVYFHSSIHVSKRLRMPISYVKDFSDAEILNLPELRANIYGHYGKDIYVPCPKCSIECHCPPNH